MAEAKRLGQAVHWHASTDGMPPATLLMLSPRFIALCLVLALAFCFFQSLHTRTEVLRLEVQPIQAQLYSPKTMLIPAVDAEGKGVVTKLEVEARAGKGRTLVNIDQLYFWVDTQHSIRIAKQLAERLTGVNTSELDLIYSIESEASVIGGESAGAAIAVATISLLQGKELNKSVMMTGTIDAQGRVGKVGGILAKAWAAKQAGMKLFLVPVGQSIQTYYEPVRHCEQIGPFTYCTTTYELKRVDVAEQVGIEVREISSVKEALEYFLMD